MTTQQDQYASVQAALVPLLILDATAAGQGVFRFTNQTNILGQNVIYNGNTYTGMPFTISGLAKSTGDSAPRPRITIANVNQVIQSLVYSAGDLSGCTLQLIRIYSTYLDAGNFTGGNPNANPGAWLSNDTYVIDNMVEMNKVSATFELCWQLDRPGVRLPLRVALRDFGFPGLGLNAP